MNKKLRKQVFDKTHYRCWYCGDPINENNFEVDHIKPIYRGQESAPELHKIDNLAPSCKPCNRLKSVFTVAQFRIEIELQVKRGFKSSINMRTSDRFGLIKIINKPVVFHFEGFKK